MALVSMSPCLAQEAGTATLKGSGYCRIVGNFKSIACARDNVIVKGTFDSSPHLHLIDGKGSSEYQSPNSSERISWKEDKGFFVVQLAAGKHRLSLSAR